MMLWNGKRRLFLQNISFPQAKTNITYICFVYFAVPGIGPLKSAFSSHRHVALAGVVTLKVSLLFASAFRLQLIS